MQNGWVCKQLKITVVVPLALGSIAILFVVTHASRTGVGGLFVLHGVRWSIALNSALLPKIDRLFPPFLDKNRSKSNSVPAALQDKYNDIIALTDPFCTEHLTQEYTDLCHALTAKLCRKRPSPVTTGKARACAIVYTLGRVNFLFDKSQTPFMRADVLCQHFSLGTSTVVTV